LQSIALRNISLALEFFSKGGREMRLVFLLTALFFLPLTVDAVNWSAAAKNLKKEIRARLK
jgi:hypothetical protein